MVKAVLADVNIEGHVDLVMAIARVADVGIASNALDSTIWQTCQDAGYVLVTNNRNEDDADSLQATIRDRNRLESLPVLTIADTERLRISREYAERVAESLLDTLLRIDELRGTGRLYLP